MRRSRYLLLVAVLLGLGACGDDPGPAPAPETRPEPASEVADEPRAGSGEEVRRRMRDLLTKIGMDPKQLRLWFTGTWHELHAAYVDAKDAIDVWQRVRAGTERHGFYPVIAHAVEGGLLDHVRSVDLDPKKIIDKAAQQTLDEWLKTQLARDPELYADAPLGEWSGRPPATEFSVTRDLDGKPATNLVLVLIPTRKPWEAIAWFGYGNWNDCPAPWDHVTAHKAWYEAYGAELVAITHDTLEFRATRPPRTRPTAMAWANQQVVYCPDAVLQGTESLRALAEGLIDCRVFGFWWD